MILVYSSQYFLQRTWISPAYLEFYLLIKEFQLSIDNEALTVRKEDTVENHVFQEDPWNQNIQEDERWNEPEVLLEVVDECDFQCDEAGENDSDNYPTKIVIREEQYV